MLKREVTVIVPTLALRARAALLRRALATVRAQAGVRAIPLVVVNGTERDPVLLRELRADPGVRVIVLDDADLPAALCAGRAHVDTEFFGGLDDDDELLPDALSLRVRALADDEACAAAVSNGFRRNGAGADVLHVPDAEAVDADPLRALIRINWLLPGSWLCRTASVGVSMFDGMPKYLECTYLALRFALDGRMRFLASPTVIWNTDTPASQSRSRAYVLGQVPALERILALPSPPEVRAAFRTRLSVARHAIADLHLHEGSRDEAWRWHLRSLRGPGGWRFLPFTRHLLRSPRGGRTP